MCAHGNSYSKTLLWIFLTSFIATVKNRVMTSWQAGAANFYACIPKGSSRPPCSVRRCSTSLCRGSIAPASCLTPEYDAHHLQERQRFKEEVRRRELNAPQLFHNGLHSKVKSRWSQASGCMQSPCLERRTPDKDHVQTQEGMKRAHVEPFGCAVPKMGTSML